MGYCVPKRPLTVLIRTLQGGEESATVFLGDRAESHAGPESPLDLFASDDGFIPVERASGDICFMSRSQIVCVTLPLAPHDPGEELPGTVVKVLVVLIDGTRLEGGLAYVQPAPSSRVQDYLNEPESFVELHAPEGVVLLNKRHIAQVSESP